MGNIVCRCQETIIFEKNNEFNDSSTNIENGFNVKNNYNVIVVLRVYIYIYIYKKVIAVKVIYVHNRFCVNTLLLLIL